MRRSYIMKRGRNLMGKDTQATLDFKYTPSVRADTSERFGDIRLYAMTLTINKARLVVRLRKGDKINISVPLGERERSRATYRVKKVISQDADRLVVDVELVWEVDK